MKKMKLIPVFLSLCMIFTLFQVPAAVYAAGESIMTEDELPDNVDYATAYELGHVELVSQTTDSYVFRNQDGSYSKYVYNVGDAIVRSESPNTNYGSDTYASICSIIGRYHYLLVNFPELAESDFFNDISISINSSYYVMFCNGINNLSGGASAYMYTGDEWSEDTITYNTFDEDGFGEYLSGVGIGWEAEDRGYYKFDISSAVQQWKNKTASPEQGLIFKNPATDYGADKSFNTKESTYYPPYLVLNYTVNNLIKENGYPVFVDDATGDALGHDQLVEQTLDSLTYLNDDGSYSLYLFNNALADCSIPYGDLDTNYGTAKTADVVEKDYFLVAFPGLSEDLLDDYTIRAANYYMYCTEAGSESAVVETLVNTNSNNKPLNEYTAVTRFTQRTPYIPIENGSTAVGGPGYYSFNLMAAVSSWQSGTGNPAMGLAFRNQSETNSNCSRIFATRETLQITNIPYLRIDYTTGTTP